MGKKGTAAILAMRAAEQLSEACEAGAAFRDAYGLTDRDILTYTNAVLPDERALAVALDFEVDRYPESVPDEVAALAFWRWYFKEYPSEGRHAGAVCAALAHAGRHAEVVEVLALCAERGAFFWDD